MKLARTVAQYGDVARDAFDREFSGLLDADWRSLAPCIMWEMVKEAKKRGGKVSKEIVELVEDDMRHVQLAVELNTLIP